MKNALSILFILLLQNFCSAQKIDGNFNDTFRIGERSNPIYLLNGNIISPILFEKKYPYGSRDQISAIIIEGDSVYMKKIGNRESILKKYLGDEVKRGVFLFFTSDVVTTLKGSSMKAFLKKNKCPTLWSVPGTRQTLTSNDSLINSLRLKNITEIQVIKSINFKKNDGNTDIFNIVILFVKKNVRLNF